MEFLFILAFILIAAGLVFSILPPLPGPVLAYAGLLVTHWASEQTQFPDWILWMFGIGMVVVTTLDYFLPIAATKKFGGTRAGIWGGIIGTVAGIVLPIPFGIILGPLLGAILGDLIGGNHIRAAIKSGFGTFVGFVAATLLKLGYSLTVALIVVFEIGAFGFSKFLELLG
jgi:uncharacterized protein